MQVKKKEKMSRPQIEAAASLFATLAEPSRLQLLQALMAGPLHVGGLMEATGMKQANVSKHLAVLHQAGLVERSREGVSVRYQLRDPFVIKLCELVCNRISQQAAAKIRELSELT
jgi:DNA-binding transcriptional ArsR family regulator